jgi:DNA-binding Xre family transcriptional regulator
MRERSALSRRDADGTLGVMAKQKRQHGAAKGGGREATTPDQATTKIAARAILAMERRGFRTQKALAEAVKMHENKVSKLKHGDAKNIRADELAAFALVLGVTTDWLLGIDDRPLIVLQPTDEERAVLEALRVAGMARFIRGVLDRIAADAPALQELDPIHVVKRPGEADGSGRGA